MQTMAEHKRKPDTKMCGEPVWCHHHCGKMHLENTTPSSLKIAGSAACLEIGSPESVRGERHWKILWEIRFGSNGRVNGQVIFPDKYLRAAFGLSDEVGFGGEWMLSEYGADTAAQGWFIRYQNFLNIPGPGTGHDGNPNISIEITEEMKNAAAALLLAKQDSPISA